MAVARFWCCERWLCEAATSPVGHVRDAHGRFHLVDVLPAFAAGPVGVHLQFVGRQHDLLVVSSISAITSTLAKLVWRRLLASKGEMRTRRWTPRSALQ
jgi:hypothetical protein